ncbi:hypothetical protein TWF281_004513 [Arthrobotrys megalospora]
MQLQEYRKFAFIAAGNQLKNGAEFEVPLAKTILEGLGDGKDFTAMLPGISSRGSEGKIEENLVQVFKNLERYFADGGIDDKSVASKVPRPTIFAYLASSKYTDIETAVKENPPFAPHMKWQLQTSIEEVAKDPESKDPESKDDKAFHLWVKFWRKKAPWSTLLRVVLWTCHPLGLPQYVNDDFKLALKALIENQGADLELMGDSVTNLLGHGGDAGESSIAGFPTIYKQKIKRLLESLAVLHRITNQNPYGTVSIFSKGYYSASDIVGKPKSDFQTEVSKEPGYLTGDGRFTAEDAAACWDAAERKVNENAFDGFKLIHDERGTGISILDEKRPKIDLDVTLAVKAQTEKVTSQQIVPPTYENLFGSHAVDMCSHGCNSVLSPLAYFVDLLQFLRQTKINAQWESGSIVKDTKYSLLTHFSARRPDILNLELSCENNVLTIPYIDLVNEVMESWIFYNVDGNPKKEDGGASSPDEPAKDDQGDKTKSKELYSSGVSIQNNSYGTVSEQLAAKPAYVSNAIYKGSVGSAVFPIGTFPYNYAIDRSRTLLKAMGIPRSDILKLVTVFGEEHDIPEKKTFLEYWMAVAQAMESLGLYPEDLEPLTGEKFDPSKAPSGNGQANPNERLRKFWGYPDKNDHSPDEMEDVAGRTALVLVKEQFLPRSGITLKELIELLKSDFINWDPLDVPGEIRADNLQSKKIIIEIPDENFKDAKLAQFDKSTFDPEHWNRFQQFIRLYKKVDCSIAELDQVILAAWGRERIQKLERPKLTTETLVEVAAIFDVVKECGLTLNETLAFWLDFRPKGGSKLYNDLFLDRKIAAHYPVFRSLSETEDAAKLDLDNPEAIQRNLNGVLAALGIKRQDYDLLNPPKDSSSETKTVQQYIETVSQTYRLYLLCKVSGISTVNIRSFLQCPLMKQFQNPFDSPRETLKFFKMWNALKAQGFSPEELLRFDGCAGKTCAAETYDTMSKTERESVDRSLVVIDRLSRAAGSLAKKYKDLEDVSSEDVERLASALFDRETVISILAFLNCQLPYAKVPTKTEGQVGPINQPPEAAGSGLLDQPPQNEQADSNETPPQPATDHGGQKDDAETLPQIRKFYEDNIAELLLQNEKRDTIKKTLLKVDESGEGEKSSVATEKRKVFYQALSDNLQNKEYNLEVIQTLLSCKVAGMNEDVIRGLLLRASLSPELGASVREDLGFLKDLSQGPISTKLATTPPKDSTHAFLKPDTSDVFRFILDNADGKSLSIKVDGKSYVFSKSYDASTSVVTPPIALMSNNFYLIEVPNKLFQLGNLRWRGVKSADVAIPASCWTERDLQNSIECNVLLKLDMLGLVMQRFSLTLPEILAIEKDNVRFPEINFGDINLKTLLAIQRYVELRNGLGAEKTLSQGLLPLFNIIDNNPAMDDKMLLDVLSKATGWPEKHLKVYLDLKKSALPPTQASKEAVSMGAGPAGDSAPGASPDTTQAGAAPGEHAQPSEGKPSSGPGTPTFSQRMTSIDELAKLRDVVKALNVLSSWDVQVSQLRKWCSIGEDPYPIANELEIAYDSKTPKEIWLEVAAPRVYDGLRERRRRVLQSFILQQSVMRKAHVLDADALFEYFMIDVQMSSSMKTSRLRQAISAIQLFVQRCLLNLEAPNVPRSCIQQNLWSWMSKYTLWEANRRTFLFPENWLEPTLRDTKSDAFKEFESGLSQKNLTKEIIDQSIRNYVYSLYDLRSLAMQTLYHEIDPSNNQTTVAIHYFGRTLGAPYKYYYRKWTKSDSTWTPWSEINVSIVTHETDTKGFAIDGPGAFLIPVVWNRRLFLFLPTFTVSTAKLKISDFAKALAKKPDPPGEGKEDVHFEDLNKAPVDSRFAIPYYRISLGWTEFRDGKWAPLQKSSDYLVEVEDLKNKDEQYEFTTAELTGNSQVPSDSGLPQLRPEISVYHFTSNFDKLGLRINVLRQGFGTEIRQIGRFELSGGTVRAIFDPKTLGNQTNILSYSHLNKSTEYYLFSNQDEAETNTINTGDENLSLIPNLKVQTYSDPDIQRHMKQIVAVLSRVDGNVNKAIMSNEMAPFLIEQCLNPVEKIFTTFADKFGFINTQAFGNLGKTVSWHELRTPAALHNWELAVHIPMLVMDRLLSSQQFDLALEVGRYIFNPFIATQDPSVDLNACWSWPPFSTLSGRQAMNSILGDPKQSESSDTKNSIEEWRKAPFVPYVVARNRPIAYMKWTVMKYLETLVAYGDFYFRQNSLESIPLATQLYIEAAHIYGHPEVEPARMGTMRTTTYQALIAEDNMDSFSNSSIKMEYMFPFGSKDRGQSDTAGPSQSVGTEIAKSILGLRATRYFALPLNPKIKEVGSLIQDRLGKIRACLDINGVPQHLPLFDAPIDPGMLVKAAASGDGGGLGAALFYVDQPMPNYRFNHILQKAFEICQELKGYENNYLSIREKRDAEALSRLRSQQDLAIGALTQDLKELALGEATKSIESLRESRKGPESRMKYYLRLLGENTNLVPDEKSEFTELEQSIDKPTGDDLRLNTSELKELDFADQSHSKSQEAADLELAASVLHLVPAINLNLAPLGCGTTVDFGAHNIAAFLSTIASVKRVDADDLSFQSSRHARRANLLSQVQERRLQANICGYELKSIDSQVRSQELRIKAAQKDIDTIVLQRDHMKQYDEFLRSKFTNEELYTWLDNTYRQTYFQTYNLAFDIAKSAERAYRFERGDDNTQFISLNRNWNSSREGLGAAEELYLSLKRLELANMERKPHDYEIRKNISLRQLDPKQLHFFRESGKAEFEIPEILYDMDFPGHYQRRIKSVSISIPCVVGPYQSISCVLRLMDHRYRSNTSRIDQDSYKESVGTPDDRFRSIRVPITSISTSSANNDSGVFELSFQDERYVPFEGAGAISKWSIELPEKYRQFNYDTISDVVLHIRYTSKDGGVLMRKAAQDNIESLLNSASSLFQVHSIIDIPNDYPNDWYQSVRAPSANNPSTAKITLENIRQRLPFFAQCAQSIAITTVYLYTDLKCDPPVLRCGETDEEKDQIQFASSDSSSDATQIRAFQSKSTDNSKLPFKFEFNSNWILELKKIENATTAKKFWLIFKYQTTFKKSTS